VYKDYVRAKIADFDPIDFMGLNRCKRVEYMNVRGHSCIDCDVAWWQDNSQMLHHDSSSVGCGWDASSGAVASEDNFGFYASTNPKLSMYQAAVFYNKLLVWFLLEMNCRETGDSINGHERRR